MEVDKLWHGFQVGVDGGSEEEADGDGQVLGQVEDHSATCLHGKDQGGSSVEDLVGGFTDTHGLATDTHTITHGIHHTTGYHRTT